MDRVQSSDSNSIRLDGRFGRPRNAVVRKRHKPKSPSASRTFQVVVKDPAEKRVPLEGVGVGSYPFRRAARVLNYSKCKAEVKNQAC